MEFVSGPIGGGHQGGSDEETETAMRPHQPQSPFDPFGGSFPFGGNFGFEGLFPFNFGVSEYKPWWMG